jgi:hypothetical protein
MNTNTSPLGNAARTGSLVLTPAQRNALSSYLRVVEEGCRQVSRSLQGSPGLFSKLKDDLPAASKNHLHSGVAALLDKLEQVKGHLELECRETDLSRSVEAYLTEVWEVLCGSKSSSLRGFGEISAGARDYLDRQVDDMLADLTAMRQSLPRRTSASEAE